MNGDDDSSCQHSGLKSRLIHRIVTFNEGQLDALIRWLNEVKFQTMTLL